MSACTKLYLLQSRVGLLLPAKERKVMFLCLFRGPLDMVNFDLTAQGLLFPPPDMFKLVNYEARTVSKRAHGIRLKCFLILVMLLEI